MDIGCTVDLAYIIDCGVSAPGELRVIFTQYIRVLLLSPHLSVTVSFLSVFCPQDVW